MAAATATTREGLQNGDGFAMLLMQLLDTEGMMPDMLLSELLEQAADTPPQNHLPGMMDELFSRWGSGDETIAAPEQWPLYQGPTKSDEDEGDPVAMAMMAQLLSAMQPHPTLVTAQPQLEAKAAQSLPAGVPAAALTDTEGILESVSAQRAAVQNPHAPQREAADLPHFSRLLNKGVDGLQAEVLPPQSDQPAESRPISFEQALRQLKAAPPPAKESPPLDIEALQANADARRARPDIEPVKAERSLPRPHDLTDQLKTGILDNLGKKESFTIKLRPEGMGEITLKLDEKDGKVMVSIATTSPQLTRLLKEDSAALQTALRPLEAEVSEIVTLPDSGSLIAGSQLNLAGQQQNMGGQRNHQAHDLPAYYPTKGESEQTGAIEALNPRISGALDSYI